jgi:hypothetical protein
MRRSTIATGGINPATARVYLIDSTAGGLIPLLCAYFFHIRYSPIKKIVGIKQLKFLTIF